MWGSGERKEARRVPACMGKKWAMDTKFNALTVNFCLFLFFCLFNSFLQVYRFKMSIS